MGQQKICGACGKVGHNKRTCGRDKIQVNPVPEQAVTSEKPLHLSTKQLRGLLIRLDPVEEDGGYLNGAKDVLNTMFGGMSFAELNRLLEQYLEDEEEAPMDKLVNTNYDEDEEYDEEEFLEDENEEDEETEEDSGD